MGQIEVLPTVGQPALLYPATISSAKTGLLSSSLSSSCSAEVCCLVVFRMAAMQVWSDQKTLWAL